MVAVLGVGAGIQSLCFSRLRGDRKGAPSTDHHQKPCRAHPASLSGKRVLPLHSTQEVQEQRPEVRVLPKVTGEPGFKPQAASDLKVNTGPGARQAHSGKSLNSLSLSTVLHL